jgi:predicted ATP-grasp superfamily ATP-dependent carboligase
MSRVSRPGVRVPADSPPVAVLNMHYSGLGIARNLAPLGVRVYGFSAEPRFPGNTSRYCKFTRSPDSLAEPEAMLDFLIAFAREHDVKPVLFPTRDHDVHFINAHREALETAFIVPFSAPDAIDRIMNKDRCYSVAARCGINLPRGVTLQSADDLRGVEALRFPVICKPLYSAHWRKPGVWEAVGKQKAVKIETLDALRAFHRRVAPLDPVMTFQEWIPGLESNLVIFGSYANRDSEVTAHFTARKRLQYPALLGTGIVVESWLVPELETISRGLLRALGFFGVSEIEYKIDERNGACYLIEINPRHWDQHRLGTLCGVNVSEAAYRDAVGLPALTTAQSATPVRWIADYEYGFHLARSILGKSSLREALSWLRGQTTFSTLDATDLRPAARLAANLLRDLSNGARARLWR